MHTHANRMISSRCLTEQELREVAGVSTGELFERAISHYPGCRACEPIMLRLFEIQRAPIRVAEFHLKGKAIPKDDGFHLPVPFWHYAVRY